MLSSTELHMPVSAILAQACTTMTVSFACNTSWHMSYSTANGVGQAAGMIAQAVIKCSGAGSYPFLSAQQVLLYV